MAAAEPSRSELSNTGYEIFIGAVPVLSLINIVLLLLLRDEGLQTVVYAIDALLSIVFLIDFLARLRRAPSRLDYVFRQFGWADLLASLPFPQVKILRVFRLIRVTRLLRRYGERNIARSLIKDRAGPGWTANGSAWPGSPSTPPATAGPPSPSDCRSPCIVTDRNLDHVAAVGGRTVILDGDVRSERLRYVA
jgi:hypothetical protein